jgi:Zn finger protein HypA/HybF involved in hydrogenase expression
MPTFAQLHTERRGVFITCANCRRGRALDILAQIVVGRGEMEINDAFEQGRFKCGACGSHRVTLHIDP